MRDIAVAEWLSEQRYPALSARHRDPHTYMRRRISVFIGGQYITRVRYLNCGGSYSLSTRGLARSPGKL